MFLPAALNPPTLATMFTHPFAYIMVATFVAAVATMLMGVAGMSNPGTTGAPANGKGTFLMALRVGLCILLLIEILIYIAYIK